MKFMVSSDGTVSVGVKLVAKNGQHKVYNSAEDLIREDKENIKSHTRSVLKEIVNMDRKPNAE